MTRRPSNIVLIGMPGSGKSTVGVILAKKSSRAFVDTDVLIQTAQQRTLQQIVDTQGYRTLRAIEERLLLNLALENHVIATGGSAVYSDKAMAHLRAGGAGGVVVFLDADLETLRARIGDFSKRGLAKRADQTFAELFEERRALYQKHADIILSCSGKTQEAVCDQLMESIDR